MEKYTPNLWYDRITFGSHIRIAQQQNLMIVCDKKVTNCSFLKILHSAYRIQNFSIDGIKICDLLMKEKQILSKRPAWCKVLPNSDNIVCGCALSLSLFLSLSLSLPPLYPSCNPMEDLLSLKLINIIYNINVNQNIYIYTIYATIDNNLRNTILCK